MPSVEIQDLWKTYQRGKTKMGSLRGTMSYFWNSLGEKAEEFNALEAVNLSISEGEVIGILGANGAGKSTLLKVLSRITFPTRGKVMLKGRVASLLEVGIGFHPELTGRENIYLSGSIYGMPKREVDAKFDRIVEFSGQEAYLDTPVKHYSSGMYMRLAFAVSVHVDPDILMIDEILAVGDQDFRKKCILKIRELYESGKTVLMVSHQMEYLRELCTRGICMQHGRIIHDGPILEVMEKYQHNSESNLIKDISTRKDRKGSGVAMISGVSITDVKGLTISYPTSGQYIVLKVYIRSTKTILNNVAIRINCFDAMGQHLFVINSKISDGLFQQCNGNVTLECHIPKLPLNVGKYYFDISLSEDYQISDALTQAFEMLVVEGMFYKTGVLPDQSNKLLTDYEWKISTEV